MPKRTKSRKKFGGLKKLSPGPLVNKRNEHNPTLFSNTTGAVTGCLGCENGNINIGSGCNLSTPEAALESAERGITTLIKGIRGQVGGNGNTGVLLKKNMRAAAQRGMTNRIPLQSVQSCNTKQSGGGDATASCVDGCNQFRRAGYGLNAPATTSLNSVVAGSGYPPVSPYNPSFRQCRKGGKKTKKKLKKKQKRRKTHKKRRRKTRRKKRKKRRKTLKGGNYKQFRSNTPITPGYECPNPGPLPWATGPLSKKRQINCQDNYNHYTGKSSPSCSN